jgi:hypothetical protein
MTEREAYTVHLVARVEHAAGPAPEWDQVAAALAEDIAGRDLRFSVDLPGGKFAGAVLIVESCDVDTAEELD